MLYSTIQCALSHGALEDHVDILQQYGKYCCVVYQVVYIILVHCLCIVVCWIFLWYIQLCSIYSSLLCSILVFSAAEIVQFS